MNRILAGCLALLAAVAVSVVPRVPPGIAETCQRTVTIQPEVSAGEDAGTLAFAVRSTGCTAAGSLAYTAEAGTARESVDFVLPDGRLQWGSGDTGTRYLTATITRDRIREAELEDFTVRLTDPSPGIRVVGTAGRGRILDDDGAGPTLVADGDVCWPNPPDFPGCSCDVGFDNVDCPPGGHLNLDLAAPATAQWSTVDGTARAGVDFVGVTDQVVELPAGATRFDLPVQFLPRPAGTPGRWFAIRISAPSSGRVVDGVAVITIGAS